MSGGQARAYELMVVLNPGQAELVSEVITTLKSNIEACDGTISRFEDCKVRTLAYRINKLRQGHYFCLISLAITKQLSISCSKISKLILIYCVRYLSVAVTKSQGQVR